MSHHTLMRAMSAAALAVLAMAAVFSPARGAAPTAGPTCGATITISTTLHHDLLGCAGNGLVVGANNITINLNGHTIGGDGVQAAGIDNTSGHRDLTIKGGTIRDFGIGVSLSGTHGNTLSHLSITRSHFSGIVIGDSSYARVQSSVVSHNGLTTDQAGITMFASQHNRIEHNSIVGNGDIGLFANEGADDNVFVGNIVTGNEEGALSLEGNRNQVTGNHLNHNGGGVVLVGERNHVTHNEISDSSTCVDGCGMGISVEGGSGNVIEHNQVTGSDDYGIRVDAYAAPADGTVIRANTVRHAGTSGISINADHAGSVDGTLIASNLVVRSQKDGIHVESSSTRLTRNVVRLNGLLGISAVTGVTDGGGNRAAGNGTPAQCTYVACQP